REEFASGREFWRLTRQGVIGLVDPRSETIQAFGPGERAAMNMALEHPDWILLIDDWRPLREAQELGIYAVCSPVLITQLKSEGHLSFAEAIKALAHLAALGTVRQGLIDIAIEQLAAMSAGEEAGQ